MHSVDTPKTVGASSEYPATSRNELKGIKTVLSFVIQQDVHLLGKIREVEGVIFQGLGSLSASSLHFLSFAFCIYHTQEVNKVESVGVH